MNETYVTVFNEKNPEFSNWVKSLEKNHCYHIEVYCPDIDNKNLVEHSLELLRKEFGETKKLIFYDYRMTLFIGQHETQQLCRSETNPQIRTFSDVESYNYYVRNYVGGILLENTTVTIFTIFFVIGILIFIIILILFILHSRNSSSKSS